MKRKYRRFGKRYLVQNVIVFVPLAALFGVAWTRWEELDWAFWLCIGLFTAGVAAALIWETKRLKKFSCPDCGAPLPEPTIKHRKPGDPINFYCPNCDTEWETGLYEPDIDA